MLNDNNNNSIGSCSWDSNDNSGHIQSHRISKTVMWDANNKGKSIPCGLKYKTGTSSFVKLLCAQKKNRVCVRVSVCVCGHDEQTSERAGEKQQHWVRLRLSKRMTMRSRLRITSCILHYVIHVQLRQTIHVLLFIRWHRRCWCGAGVAVLCCAVVIRIQPSSCENTNELNAFLVGRSFATFSRLRSPIWCQRFVLLF